MLMWSTMILAPSGQAGTTWANLNPFDQVVILLYGVAALQLWYAPIYGWLLLISAWARRSPFLWAVLPPFAIGIFEKIAFKTSYVGLLLRDRFIGHMEHAFVLTKGVHQLDSISQLTPGNFLSTPALWIGLLFAAACLAAAVRLRRNREPI
jgi:ABC-2 type transport system permease protein